MKKKYFFFSERHVGAFCLMGDIFCCSYLAVLSDFAHSALIRHPSLFTRTHADNHQLLSEMQVCSFQSSPLIHPSMVPQGSYNKLAQWLRRPEKVSGTRSPKHTHNHSTQSLAAGERRGRDYMVLILSRYSDVKLPLLHLRVG